MNVFSETSYYSPNNGPDTLSLYYILTYIVFVSSSFLHETVMIYYHAYFYILQILYLSQNIVSIKCLKYII